MHRLPAPALPPLHRLVTDLQDSSETTEKLGLEDRFRHARTGNAYEQSCVITAWQQLYDQLCPGVFTGELKEMWLDELQCFEETTSLALRQSCMVWPDAWWFGIPYTEGKAASNGYTPIDDDAIAVSAGGHEFELTTPDDFHIMGLVIRQHELETHAATELEGGLALSVLGAPVLKVGRDKKRALIRTQQHLLGIAARRPQDLHHPVSHRFARHELLDQLIDLLADAQALAAPRQSRSRGSHWRTVRTAREYVLDHPDEPVALADLCQHLHVSRRTLQNCFHNTLDICPLGYLKAIRLNAVRRELLSPYSSHATIQEAAFAWGFWHMSQFAVDYQRLFGEKPSASLRRGRALPG
ncbi:HTH-type transcriptional regulator EutR [Silvimonas iriomotensis]|nr:HTH-type transcriptional regulator EutR [Silvimonas iriomotensis]